MFSSTVRLTRIARLASALMCALLLAACDTDLYSDLSERDANEIVATLDQAGISSHRTGTVDQGYTVSVDDGQFSEAIAILSERGLPRDSHESIGDLFKGDGIVSTRFEENARLLYATGQELAESITRIDGVASARVHLTMAEGEPFERSAPVPRAAVFVYHERDSAVTADVATIKTMVMSSVADLTYDQISVAFFPVRSTGAGFSNYGLGNVNISWFIILGCGFAGWLLLGRGWRTEVKRP